MISPACTPCTNPMSHLWPLISGCRCRPGRPPQESETTGKPAPGNEGQVHRQPAPPPTTNISNTSDLSGPRMTGPSWHGRPALPPFRDTLGQDFLRRAFGVHQNRLPRSPHHNGHGLPIRIKWDFVNYRPRRISRAHSRLQSRDNQSALRGVAKHLPSSVGVECLYYSLCRLRVVRCHIECAFSWERTHLACLELETPSTLEACAPRDDLRVLAVRFLVPAGLLSVLLTGKLLAAWKEFHPSFPGSAGILFTTTTRRREEILCDSLRLRVFGVRFFWLRRGCTVFICVHLWFRFHGF